MAIFEETNPKALKELLEQIEKREATLPGSHQFRYFGHIIRINNHKMEMLRLTTTTNHVSIPSPLHRSGQVGTGSNRPETNFPRISVDTNRVHYLVEKSGLDVDPRRLVSPIEQGESRHVGV